MMKLRLNKKAPQEAAEKRLVEILKKPHALKKERLMIWGLLVDYASGNGDFEELVWACVHVNGHWIYGAERSLPNLEYREIREGLTLKDAAVKYQADFKWVLLWLVHRNREAGETALTFLWKHAKAIKTEPVLNDDLRYGKSLIDSGSAASPICEFILDGIDRHNKGEGDIPLAACKVCAKFMVVERPGRKMYCSKNCGVKDFYAKRGGAKMYMRDLGQNPMFKKKQKK